MQKLQDLNPLVPSGIFVHPSKVYYEFYKLYMFAINQNKYNSNFHVRFVFKWTTDIGRNQ